MRALCVALVSIGALGCGEARPIELGHARKGLVHPDGILDPENRAEFHGDLVRALGWNLGACTGCHGEDFAGGASGVSCNGCHRPSPSACTGCHGQPPATGAHPAHAARGLDCTECHEKPLVYTDVGHLRSLDGTVIDRAQVRFGALAATAGPARSGPPAYDPAGASCAQVYCHGATLGDSAAGSTQPRWRGAAPCGSCHGVPPASHASTRCAGCHPRVTDAQGAIVDQALHVDGKLSLGDDSGTCTACHDVARSGSGAHAAHLGAPHRLRAPLACGDCHLVPASVSSPGHIDSDLPAEVFPDGSSALARSDGAQPSYGAGRCSDVYCHGGGAALGGDAAPTVDRTPSWTATGAAECGRCHGIPPLDSVHYARFTLSQCTQCHPQSIDAQGNLTAKHLDGVVDVR